VPAAPVVRTILGNEAARYRDLRLEALRESPTSFTATWDDERMLPREEWEARVASSVGGTSTVAVADSGDELVGLAVGIPWGGRVRVVSVWVAPRWRGQGLAARLIEHVCDWAAHAGYREAQIETAMGNPSPRALYQRLGFMPVDETPPPECEGVLVRSL
jgi:GNAT superfamily N-acetyltransferase